MGPKYVEHFQFFSIYSGKLLKFRSVPLCNITSHYHDIIAVLYRNFITIRLHYFYLSSYINTGLGKFRTFSTSFVCQSQSRLGQRNNFQTNTSIVIWLRNSPKI